MKTNLPEMTDEAFEKMIQEAEAGLEDVLRAHEQAEAHYAAATTCSTITVVYSTGTNVDLG